MEISIWVIMVNDIYRIGYFMINRWYDEQVDMNRWYDEQAHTAEKFEETEQTCDTVPFSIIA